VNAALVTAATAAALCLALPASAQPDAAEDVPPALREQEALADGRERRLREALDRLEAREGAALAETRRLEEREREISAREQHLGSRSERIPSRGAPTQRQSELDALETQLVQQDRNLGAQARSLGAAIDAALGRERSAASREDAERDEERRHAEAAGWTSVRALQLDARRQAVGARTRRLAAAEARVAARGERLDALESRTRIERERLEVRARRLDAMEERLDLLEARLSEPSPAPAPGAAADAGAAPRKGKATFVTIVRSPTALVRERASAPSAAETDAALHPGIAVEKAIAAAAVVTFATPASQLAELDRETVAGIARVAGQERCELLIWARAADGRLIAEAQRRAAEIRTVVVATGVVSEKQVVVRITTRPGPESVDVVVSALRENAVRGEPAPGSAGRNAPSLQGGEAGKRQIREAVQAVHASIEACLADAMEQRRLARAEGVLKLAVSAAGTVAKVASNGDLSGTAVRECLGDAARAWVFPLADAGYAADVPVAVIRSAPAP
jgi:hypothetical protein